MTDGQESIVVEGALNDCAEEFKRGVHSFHGSSGDSDLTIDPGVVDALKDLLRDTFSEQLDPEEDRTEERRDWNADKRVILPVAFYTGALAALYAQPRDAGKLVTNERAVEALKHVSGYCHGPMKGEDSDTSDDVRVRWRYCPDLARGTQERGAGLTTPRSRRDAAPRRECLDASAGLHRRYPCVQRALGAEAVRQAHWKGGAGSDAVQGG